MLAILSGAKYLVTVIPRLHHRTRLFDCGLRVADEWVMLGAKAGRIRTVIAFMSGLDSHLQTIRVVPRELLY